MSTDRKASTDHSAGGGAQPMLSQPHTRRMSRMDGGMHMNHQSRRMSVYRRMSIASYRSNTDQSSVSARKPHKMENTYRMEPDPDYKFNVARVEAALRSILESFLTAEEYETEKCKKLAQNLTEVIKDRMKSMAFPRYKYVVNVAVGENGSQSMECASRCVWNTDTDSFAAATYKNQSLFALATVYGLYFE